MTGLDHARHASLELLLSGARLRQQLGTEAPAFLSEYADEFLERGRWIGTPEDWRERLWREAEAVRGLPLVRLAAAGAGRIGVELLALAALAAEDARVAALLGSEGFAAVGTLVALHRSSPEGDRPEAVRRAIGWLVQTGLFAIVNSAAPHHAREVCITDIAWAFMVGGEHSTADHQLFPVDAAPHLSALVLAPTLLPRICLAQRLMAEEPDTIIWLRGPQDNGRRTLALALARELGSGVVTVRLDPAKPEILRAAGLAAFLHDAVLVVEAASAPGEPLLLPAPPIAPLRTAVVTPTHNALETSGRPMFSLDLALPGPAERLALWRHAAPHAPPGSLEDAATQFRIGSGSLLRAAAAVRQAGEIDRQSVRQALRDLQDGRLDAVATRIETEGPEEFLVLSASADAELDGLVLRCRHREALAMHAGPGTGSSGVRALLAGPSGAGKTLAARCLARRLGKDVWRIDLAAAVSKYIGETEKTLDRAFAAAEERDIVLLLDEGDALMTRRTDVGTATDRYANLETNFLLQRIESFSGILIVTTNAADRIDPAFQRRMDAVIHFTLPDELARYEILLRHLGDHEVGDELAQEVAVRCMLSGGQLRNVALHARLLAIEACCRPSDRELRRAVEREYRKVDGFCPLKPLLSAVN